MVIQHNAGWKHANDGGLSQIPYKDYCDCYQVGVDLASLPFEGCNFCTRDHASWAHFESNDDNVVPLAVQTVQVLVRMRNLQILCRIAQLYSTSLTSLLEATHHNMVYFFQLIGTPVHQQRTPSSLSPIHYYHHLLLRTLEYTVAAQATENLIPQHTLVTLAVEIACNLLVLHSLIVLPVVLALSK